MKIWLMNISLKNKNFIPNKEFLEKYLYKKINI